MKDLFKLGENLTGKKDKFFLVVGFIFIITVWQMIVTIGGITNTIFPSPISVVLALIELFKDYNLLGNTWYSIKLNFAGYVEAIVISTILGFVIGIFPVLKSMFSRWVDAIRFLPLTALTGIFIGIFKLGFDMRVHFLSFGIIIYLLPIFITRINYTESVYKQTVWTLGASKWQTFRYVYFPSVMSKIFDDIKVITAISWTYIIVIESIAKDLGVGALIATAGRQSRTDWIFAVLVMIIFIGYLTDLLFNMLDKWFYPYKYESSQIKKDSIFARISTLLFKPKTEAA
jgi:NitT/TauT family transport system permease protein